MKEIKEDSNEWEDTPESWEIINTVKMSILPQILYRVNEIPINISTESLQKWKKNQTLSS